MIGQRLDALARPAAFGAHRGNHPRAFVVARQTFDVGIDMGLLRAPGGVGRIFGVQAASRLRWAFHTNHPNCLIS